jgi:hypothetical protein
LQRQRQQVALAAIAERTKIKASLLEGLERDDASHWPTGIFRRAFIRAYAEAIGLDPDPIVREFLELHPDPDEVTSTVVLAPLDAQGHPVNGPPPTRLRCLLRSSLEALAGRRPQTVEERGAAVATTVAPSRPLIVERPPVFRQPDLTAVARLCTKLGRVLDNADLPPLLEEAARILDAVGVIVWVWEPMANALTPTLAYGYSDAVLAQLPGVRRDADNPVASAFRSAEMRTANGDDQVTGAVVAPLMGPSRCIGVLALELRGGAEQRESVRALATILAAQLVTLVGAVPLAEAVSA